jgi:hypothetical protein
VGGGGGVENKKGEEREKGGDAEVAWASLDWMLSFFLCCKNAQYLLSSGLLITIPYGILILLFIDF